MSGENPAPRPAGVPKAEPITFGEMWTLLDNERFHSAVMRDLASQNPDDARAMEIAAHHGRREDCFEVMQVILARIGDDDMIKARLREIARDEAERQAAVDAIDNPDKDDEK